MQPKLRVFISSSSKDTQVERKAVIEQIVLAGHLPVSLELFSAGNKTDLEIIKQAIDECDICIMIVGSLFGPTTIDDLGVQKSILEVEYEYAQSLDKPIFVLLLDEDTYKKRRAGLKPNDPERKYEDLLIALRDKIRVINRGVSIFFEEKWDIAQRFRNVLDFWIEEVGFNVEGLQKVEAKTMNGTIQILRLGIDGRWTAEEMAHSLLHIQDLYNLRLVIQLAYEDKQEMDWFYNELIHFPPFQRKKKRRPIYPLLFGNPYHIYPTRPLISQDISRISNYLYPQEKLEVRRIQYGSEGFKDLAGLGEIVGHIKDFVLKLVEHKSTKRQRELENEKREIENQQLRIQNARNFVSLAKECGYSKTEMRGLVTFVDERQQTLIDLIDTDKIKSAHLLNANESHQQ